MHNSFSCMFISVLYMLYAFFWVIPSVYGNVSERSVYTYLPMKMEQTECSEMSAYKIPRRKHTTFRTRRKFEIKNSLHVSSTHVLIIGRISCINMTSGICHSV